MQWQKALTENQHPASAILLPIKHMSKISKNTDNGQMDTDKWMQMVS